MKLKNTFKLIGVTLFLGALLLMLYFQNPKADVISVVALVSFGCVIAFSGACLVTGELIGRIETLENKVFRLEEELKKLKNKENDNE
ncbi:MAG: hypothetical protein IKU61_04605 [Clostridia bacterium]|nr:hypothetical protein [Clostridia bacterium]